MRSPLLALSTFAFAPLLGAQAWLVDSDLDRLFSVDLATGAATFVASTANNTLGTPADLAWVPSTNSLWTIDLGTGAAGTINTTTGIFTPVFQTGLTGWQAMAWDPVTQKFYLNNQNNPDLYALDPATGVTTLIGDTGLGLVTAMDVDSSGQLWGIDFFSPGNLVRINKATAAATPIGPTTLGFQDMAFAPNGRLYAANTTTDSLYTIDTVTGIATLVGANGAGVQFAKGFEIPSGGGIFPGGTGCRDSGGVQLTMSSVGAPTIGNTVQLGCSVQVGASYVILLGLSNAASPIGPLPVNLAPFAPGCTLYQSADFALGGAVQGQTVPLGIPNDPNIVGATVFVQSGEVDFGVNLLNIVLSNYLTITVQ